MEGDNGSGDAGASRDRIHLPAENERSTHARQTFLFRACWQGKTLRVQQLLQNLGAADDVKVNVNTAAAAAGDDSGGGEGYTPLHAAAYQGHADIARMLTERGGADVDLADAAGETALYKACCQGRPDVVRFLLDSGADVGVADREGDTALHAACHNGHADVVALLLGYQGGQGDGGGGGGGGSRGGGGGGSGGVGCILNHRNTAGQTALWTACWQGHLSTVQLLLENGADANVADYENGFPLHIACCGNHNGNGNGDGGAMGNTDVVRLLLGIAGEAAAASDVNARNAAGETALFQACWHGNASVVKLLLDKGADVRIQTRNGFTALHAACFNGDKRSDIARMLLDAVNGDAADTDRPGSSGLLRDKGLPGKINQSSSGVGLLTGKKDVSVVDLINQSDNAGRTALMLACCQGNEDCAEMLLTNGADVHAVTRDGMTSVHAACLSGHTGVAAVVLVARGEGGGGGGGGGRGGRGGGGGGGGADVDVDAADCAGQTALFQACWGGRVDTVTFLLERGADATKTTQKGLSPLDALRHAGHADLAASILKRKRPDIDNPSEGDDARKVPPSKKGVLSESDALCSSGHPELPASLLTKEGAEMADSLKPEQRTVFTLLRDYNPEVVAGGSLQGSKQPTQHTRRDHSHLKRNVGRLFEAEKHSTDDECDASVSLSASHNKQHDTQTIVRDDSDKADTSLFPDENTIFKDSAQRKNNASFEKARTNKDEGWSTPGEDDTIFRDRSQRSNAARFQAQEDKGRSVLARQEQVNDDDDKEEDTHNDTELTEPVGLNLTSNTASEHSDLFQEPCSEGEAHWLPAAENNNARNEYGSSSTNGSHNRLVIPEPMIIEPEADNDGDDDDDDDDSTQHTDLFQPSWSLTEDVLLSSLENNSDTNCLTPSPRPLHNNGQLNLPGFDFHSRTSRRRRNDECSLDNLTPALTGSKERVDDDDDDDGDGEQTEAQTNTTHVMGESRSKASVDDNEETDIEQETALRQPSSNGKAANDIFNDNELQANTLKNKAQTLGESRSKERVEDNEQREQEEEETAEHNASSLGKAVKGRVPDHEQRDKEEEEDTAENNASSQGKAVKGGVPDNEQREEDTEQATALHRACSEGKSASVRLLLQRGADPNSPADAEGCTPLHAACRNDHGDIVQMLITSGADVDARDAEFGGGETALYTACLLGKRAAVKVLVDNGADVNTTAANNGWTALHVASYKGHTNICLILVSHGADVDRAAPGGETALYKACWQRNAHTVRLLLSKGASAQAEKHNGLTPLHAACYHGYAEIAQLLLDQGRAPVDKADQAGKTALHTACRQGAVETTSTLLDGGANGDSERLDAAAHGWLRSNGAVETTRILLDGGANVELVTQNGWTPLHTACFVGHTEVALLLIDHGAKVNRDSSNGESALYKACWQGREETVRMLLDRGGDPSLSSERGRTPLHIASRENQEGVVRLLIDRGVRDDAVDSKGRTALDYAREKRHGNIVKLLRTHIEKQQLRHGERRPQKSVMATS